MLSTTLVMPDDTEELALTINGKRRKISKKDFIAAMKSSNLEDKIIENIFTKFKEVTSKWFEFIDKSFLDESTRKEYKTLITDRCSKI